MIIEGSFYDGISSRKSDAILLYDGQRLRIKVDNATILTAENDTVEIQPRLGNTARRIAFSNGAAFVTSANNQVDQLANNINPSPWHGWVHRIESRLSYILISLLLVIGFIWWFVTYGLPWSAEKIAYQLPIDITERVNKETLALMDKTWFEPSTLSEKRREELRRRFSTYIDSTSLGKPKILFRHSEELGANALALPPSTVIFTDQLVELSKNDQELDAIMFHELGHLEKRHGVRQAIQASALTLVYIFVIGDISTSVSDMALGLPLVLTEMGYSREFEREADAHALAQLQLHDIPTHHFADILLRLEQQMLCGKGKTKVEKGCVDSSSSEETIFHYLSTHPSTKKRIAAFK